MSVIGACFVLDVFETPRYGNMNLESAFASQEDPVIKRESVSTFCLAHYSVV